MTGNEIVPAASGNASTAVVAGRRESVTGRAARVAVAAAGTGRIVMESSAAGVPGRGPPAITRRCNKHLRHHHHRRRHNTRRWTTDWLPLRSWPSATTS